MVLSLAIAALTLAAFHSVCANNFIDLDDPYYVTNNTHLQQGICWESLRWAWTDCSANHQWVPLTRLSLLLDHELSGMNPAGYHRTNLVLHVANAVVLFWLLQSLTGAVWRSALVAAFFAVHPLRVESVAWIAERKDVLSTLFGLLAVAAYAHYARRPGLGRYLGVVVLFTLSLLAKPMLVTLPVLLLLIDFWPLGRLRLPGWSPGSDTNPAPPPAPVPLRRLVGEKLPLAAIAVAFGLATVALHRQTTATYYLGSLPLGHRIGNAVVAYTRYLDKTFWPVGLAIWYPPSNLLVLNQVIEKSLLLLAVSVGALWTARSRPYLLVGWLWFLTALLPVIGVIPVQGSALGDRYTYVPHMGLLVLLIWGSAGFLAEWRIRPLVWVPGAGLLLIGCVVGTVQQGAHWRDSRSLWEHTLAVTPDNPMAHVELGLVAYREGKSDEATLHFADAERMAPAWAVPHFGLGLAHSQRGAVAQAEHEFQAVRRLEPNNVELHQQLERLLTPARRAAGPPPLP